MILACNKENMVKLVNALKSGKYKQTSHGLKNTSIANPKFCCLGVACDISGQGSWTGFSWPYYYVNSNDSSNNVLPNAVSEWLGIHSATLLLTHGRTGVIMNDSGKSFTEIAQAIEETYL